MMYNTDSILLSLKKMLVGTMDDDMFYDMDLIVHINAAFMVLNQLGVGPKKTFRIKDESATWEDFLGDNEELEMVKDYMYAKVRYSFDPPSGAAMEALKNVIAEYEWRLNSRVDYEYN